ncbi:MAG: acyltransferase [Pseudomonadota bacterium]|nr:acyltransferase [Pseudomonadota bacterium]
MLSTIGPALRTLVRRSLADCLNQGRDNFLPLRLIAAVLVVFGHSYALAQSPGLHDFIGKAGWGPGVYTGSIAVDIFFVVSGFLVVGSYVRRRDLKFFVGSRVLRILPAYLVCVVLCAYLIGPFVTQLPVVDYLLHRDTLAYVLKNLDFIRLEWYLPGVFESNPHPRVVNGSLWTLPVEVRLYVLVALVGACGLLHRRWMFNLLLGAVVMLWAWQSEPANFLFRNDTTLRLAGLFALGSAFYLNREFIPLNGYLACVLVLIAWWMHGTPYFMSLFGLALGYGSLWFAYVPRLGRFNRIGDYSYGVYLWGFPVQQLVVRALEAPTPMLLFFGSLPIVLLIAIASWHWVEKPLLRLKHTPMQRWPLAVLGRDGVREVPGDGA